MFQVHGESLVRTPDESTAELSRIRAYVIDAIDCWSDAFARLTLPSRLGSKCAILECTDEGAKVMSIGMYFGQRTGRIGDVPYDGRTYEERPVRDRSKGMRSLWPGDTELPAGFERKCEPEIRIPLGIVTACYECKGRGDVRCSRCGGIGHLRERDSQGNVEFHDCCGSGRVECDTCEGYGRLLQVLRIDTTYEFEGKHGKHYSGRLPEQRLLTASGTSIFRHVVEFSERGMVAAMAGANPDDMERLFDQAQREVKAELTQVLAQPSADSAALCDLVDKYFAGLSNPALTNSPLVREVLPVRIKCEVTDVPVKAVNYRYKDANYKLCVYGQPGKVWPDGERPVEFTWKVAGSVAVLLVIAIIIIVGAMASAPHAYH